MLLVLFSTFVLFVFIFLIFSARDNTKFVDERYYDPTINECIP